MFKQLIITLFLITLVSCGKHVTREGMTKLTNRFENAQSQLEQKAQAGEITWVQATTRTRDMQKAVKVKLDASGARHSWRYDSDSEEYHSYCIALAEELDENKLSFAQFDAARKRRSNEIEARTRNLENQEELIENSSPRKQKCVTEKVFDNYETKCY